MDSRLFVLPTQPDLYNHPSNSVAKEATLSRLSPHGIYAAGPAPDARYPGWAAPMEDARLVTDYRTHCYRNIPAGQQFASVQWMQRNTDNIIKISRQRQAEQAGAIYSFDPTVVPPPSLTVQCSPDECEFRRSGKRYGIGTERKEPVPNLFGTFNNEKIYKHQERPPITRSFEGGRNSLRGRFFTDLGNAPVGTTNYSSTYIKAS